MKKLLLALAITAFAAPALAQEANIQVSTTTSVKSATVITESASDASQTVVRQDGK